MYLDEPIPSKYGRIILTKPVEADDETTAALRAHPETLRYLAFLPQVFSVEDARTRRLERATDPTLVDFNISLASGGVIGSTGIFYVDDVNKKCEMGILMNHAYFRGGYASEALYTCLVYAFETRKMHRVVFQTNSENAAMRGWLEMAGVTLEGIQRQMWPDPTTGGYNDVALYAVLEDEWFGATKGKLEAKLNRAYIIKISFFGTERCLLVRASECQIRVSLSSMFLS
ncbi:acyl-CoA N-acyltransferase [Roridomyces roridus]|uniref:Acyl-CoA N-acyltransferase n=1 Tax=Roridomyces roridus TaxID=1738132 RepID=A0AAD7C5Z1_9AGAR|nr:acyl-CoA N-acyltransferase [Roridomyces roridus]